ncbi:hypothetical protein PPO43_15865 [Saprospira sp. CCB-QB6]|uniref:hypothetical protein n=1 Tax=Saprospira sp. CCB-QB6 TaxID=3023936 RepID=UPI00234AF66F|nr:hypothetical protein [Saprospira sp. CCB-QB6]WCL81450.1 hypothetical protein PPO43_15865 [Saprospira sp. CCB-QB6]
MGNLQEVVLGGIQEFLITAVFQAGIEWIIGLLTPAGAFVKAAMAIIDIVKFFIENGSQIMALVQSIIDSLAAIAAGDVGFVAQAVEGAMASTVPILIDFLASLLGIDGLSDKVQEIVGSIRKRIDDAITGLIDKAKAWFKGNGKDKRKEEEEEEKEVDEITISFTMNGEDHTLFIRQGEIRMASKQAKNLHQKIKDTKAALETAGITTKDLTNVNSQFEAVLQHAKKKNALNKLKTREDWMPLVKNLIASLEDLAITDPTFVGLLGDLDDLSKEAVEEIVAERQKQIDDKVLAFVDPSSFVSLDNKLGHTLVMVSGSLQWAKTTSAKVEERVAISASAASKLVSKQNALNVGGGDNFRGRGPAPKRGGIGGTGMQINLEEKTETATWEEIRNNENFEGYINYHIDVVKP